MNMQSNSVIMSSKGPYIYCAIKECHCKWGVW